MKRWRLIGLGCLLIFSTAIEIAWLWPLSGMFLTFHLFFIVIATLTFVSEWSKVIWYALAHGFILDLYSPQLFGLYLCTALVLTGSIALLQTTWLKQASLLSVATIAAISFVFADALVFIWQWGSPWQATLSQVIGGWLAMVMLTTLAARLVSSRYEKFF